MNLENLKVQELSVQEQVNTDGGYWGIAAVALCIAALNTDWDAAAADFQRGLNS